MATTVLGSACAICARLRATALGFVGHNGIEALTVERISDEAGLAIGAVRSHHPTAADCWYDVYEEVSGSIYDDFAAAFSQERSWRQAIRVAARTLLVRMAARPAQARLCLVEATKGDHELLRLRMVARGRLVQLFASELDRRPPRGTADVPEMQLELLIGVGFQAIAGAVAEGRVDDLPGLAPELASRAHVFEPGIA